MFNLGRLASAVLYGVIVFIVTYIIGLLCIQFGLTDIGELLKKFAPLLGLLAGIVSYLTGSTPRSL